MDNCVCLILTLAGGVLPPILLLDTVEDSGNFATLKSLHGAAKEWLQ